MLQFYDPNLIIFLKQVDTEMRRIGENTATLTFEGVLKSKFNIFLYLKKSFERIHMIFYIFFNCLLDCSLLSSEHYFIINYQFHLDI